MSELERDLELLRGNVRFPETPAIASRVAGRLAADDAPAPTHPRLSRRAVVAVAIAAFLLIAAGAVAAIPDARHAVLRVLGLEGATVERVETQPRAPVARHLDLGQAVSLARAGQEVEFIPLVPRARVPDRVFVSSRVAGGEVSLLYRPQPGLPRGRFTRFGLLVGELRGDLNPELIRKMVGPDGRIKGLEVANHAAIWVAGAPHELLYETESAAVGTISPRLAGNVLLVQWGRRLVRLEGRMGLGKAIRIARSLAPPGR
jgi:hypothetical protein